MQADKGVDLDFLVGKSGARRRPAQPLIRTDGEPTA